LLCQFERLIFPRDAAAVTASSFMIVLYRPCEIIKDASGSVVHEVKAVGYCLPISGNIRYDMQGHWSKNVKHGVQFEVERYDEIVVPTREGVISYLSSGQIKGVGPKLAERIYDAFAFLWL
jgi:exodeoxyribonuclease V alpha subunit